MTMGFPVGLAQAMHGNNARFPLRVWIIDNSRSMGKDDGNRIHESANPAGGCCYKVVQCTRWKEMRETVFFHAEMAAKVQAPTMFRLLNKPRCARLPREFGVAREGPHWIQRDLQVAQDTVKKVEPKGCTPLSKRVCEIRENILTLQDQLDENEEQVVVVLATDGIPTNREGESTLETREEFVQALKSLEGLPIYLVIRLCTQTEEVVEFYNSLDRDLDLNLEVLDDYFSEAKELYRYNKWINYALPLHRAREMGFHHPMFDLLDERKLTLHEVKEYFSFLFGKERVDQIPDPVEDFKGFLKGVKKLLESEQKPYNPIAKKATPWADLRKLARAYRGRGKSCSIM